MVTEETQGLPTDKMWPIIIDKIKKKYETYSLKDEETYPPLLFNWTPEPYQWLIESFEVELSLLLGKSRGEVRGMIPGPSTFAQIFRNNYQPKGEKLRGCYLYATGKSKLAFEREYKTVKIPSSKVVELPNRTLINQFIRPLSIVFAVVGLISLLIIYERNNVPPAAGLTIKQPASGKSVSQEIIAEGEVSNADTVWVVVRYVNGLKYWVQSPIKVNDGRWEGTIYIGGEDKEDIGIKCQIKAFVKPDEPLKSDTVLHAWPKAALSSKTVEVIRASPNGLILSQPVNGKTVPQQIFAEGKVSNANIVWIVIRDPKRDDYYVQAPIKVKADGTWKGLIHIGGPNKAHIGAHAEIRAFVNLANALEENTVLHSWPEAQLSSEGVEVIRGPEEFD